MFRYTNTRNEKILKMNRFIDSCDDEEKEILFDLLKDFDFQKDSKASGVALDEFDIPQRVVNRLKIAGIYTVEQLRLCSKQEVMSIRGIGAKSIRELYEAVGV